MLDLCFLETGRLLFEIVWKLLGRSAVEAGRTSNADSRSVRLHGLLKLQPEFDLSGGDKQLDQDPRSAIFNLVQRVFVTTTVRKDSQTQV